MNSRQISSYILILLSLPFTLISAKPKEPVDYVDMFTVSYTHLTLPTKLEV